MSTLNGRSPGLGDVNTILTEEFNGKLEIWELTRINEPSQCRSLKLPEDVTLTRVARLMYMNRGDAIIALGSDNIHVLWKWQRGGDSNARMKATVAIPPQIWEPRSGQIMINEHGGSEELISCFALSNNDTYLISASGGKISLYNLMTFRTITTFTPPPPTATSIALYPQDNNIIAIGMDDSTIQIYNVRLDQVRSKLRGHSKRVTGLVFSPAMNVLVSSGPDAWLCVWKTDVWERERRRCLELPTEWNSTGDFDTCLQIHHDQMHFLVVHETQLAIYDITNLDCNIQWMREGLSSPAITHATFSCDSRLVYACFMDATVQVFNAENLRPQCCIHPTAYLSTMALNNIDVVVIAAHPQDVYQFAVGMSDGSVHLFEPLHPDDTWGTPPPLENGVLHPSQSHP